MARAGKPLAQPAKRSRPCSPSLRCVNCRITSYSTGEVLDTVEMHVLAHAYRAAWRSMYERDPVGRHVIAPLDAMIVFYPGGDP